MLTTDSLSGNKGRLHFPVLPAVRVVPICQYPRQQKKYKLLLNLIKILHVCYTYWGQGWIKTGKGCNIFSDALFLDLGASFKSVTSCKNARVAPRNSAHLSLLYFSNKLTEHEFTTHSSSSSMVTFTPTSLNTCSDGRLARWKQSLHNAMNGAGLLLQTSLIC